VAGGSAVLNVKHFISKVPRREAFSGKTLYRDEPLVYRAELARAHRRYTSRYAKDVADLDLLIDALAPAGLIPTNVLPLPKRKPSTPDFELTFDKRTVYCAVASAGEAPSMLWRFSVAELEIAVNDMLDRRPDLAAKLGHRFLAFVPSSPIRSDDIPVTVDEIASFLAAENLETYGTRYGARIPEAFPLLSRADTVAYTARAERPLIAIQQPASAFGGAPVRVDEILRALQEKQQKRYEGFRPIWLVIGATDVLSPLAEVVKKFRAAQPRLDPFERVFISTSHESFMMAAKDASDA
jgi:hypothetical protein